MLRLPNVAIGDVTQFPNGSGTFDVGAANEGSKILFYNESAFNLQLDFYNGSTDTLHAWEASYWTLDGDTKQIGWLIDPDSLDSTDAPLSAVFLTLYGANETIQGTYPTSLVRQANFGNPGGISTSTDAIQNIGNTAGTIIIKAQPTGDTNFPVQVTNDGNVILGDVAHPAVIIITGNMDMSGDFTANNADFSGHVSIPNNINYEAQDNTGTLKNLLRIANTNKVVLCCVDSDGHIDFRNESSVANFIFDVGGTDGIEANVTKFGALGTPGSIINANPINTHIGSGGSVTQDVSGTQITVTNTSGFTLNQGKINLVTGGLTRISTFTGAATGTYTHNLGTTPDIVLVICSVSGSETVGYDTPTTTNVHITSAAGLAFKAVAFKF